MFGGSYIYLLSPKTIPLALYHHLSICAKSLSTSESWRPRSDSRAPSQERSSRSVHTRSGLQSSGRHDIMLTWYLFHVLFTHSSGIEDYVDGRNINHLPVVELTVGSIPTPLTAHANTPQNAASHMVWRTSRLCSLRGWKRIHILSEKHSEAT